MGNNTNASPVTAFLQDPDLPITKDGAAYSDYVLLNANGTDTPGPPVNYPLDLANVHIAHYEQVWWLWRGVVVVAWCGVAWCGVVWSGVVWSGVWWCGVVWSGVGRGRVECFLLRGTESRWQRGWG